MKKLLAIFAHPDDESFGPSAATLAKYAHEGVAVYYVCATRGEAGTLGEHFLSNGSPADVRTRELQRAGEALGLSAVYFLGYRDSGMPGAPDNHHEQSLLRVHVDEVAWSIIAYMNHIHPDVIITHDQYGWYGHPDHIKCYEAVLRAYELAYGFNPALLKTSPSDLQGIPRLYTSTFPKWPIKLIVRTMPLVGRDPSRYGQNGDIDLTRIAAWRVPVSTRIDVRPYLAMKACAAACHVSQIPLTKTRNTPLRLLLKRAESTEVFHRLYPFSSNRKTLEYSLFGSDQPPFSENAMTWKPSEAALETRSCL